MQISVDPTATLQAVAKTEQALEDLEEIFETCDLATFYVAAALEHGAPALSDSVRGVAAREGGHRTEPFAKAHRATTTLRGTVADFVRYEEGVVRELEEIGQGVLHGVEDGAALTLGILQQGISEAEEFGKSAVHKAEEIGEGAVHKAEQLGEGAVHKAEEIGEDLKSGAEEVGEFLGL
jgi:hypothetical protein